MAKKKVKKERALKDMSTKELAAEAGRLLKQIKKQTSQIDKQVMTLATALVGRLVVIK